MAMVCRPSRWTRIQKPGSDVGFLNVSSTRGKGVLFCLGIVARFDCNGPCSRGHGPLQCQGWSPVGRRGGLKARKTREYGLNGKKLI